MPFPHAPCRRRPAAPRFAGRSPRRFGARALARCALALAPLLLAAACHKPTYVVAGRWSPVHVVVEAPAAATTTVRVALRVTVADQVAVDGPVVFPAGRTQVDLPTVNVPAGAQDVDVWIAGRPRRTRPRASGTRPGSG